MMKKIIAILFLFSFVFHKSLKTVDASTGLFGIG